MTRAISKREHDGPALVEYIKSVLRKTGDSQGWSALLEARRLDLSFEDMVLNVAEPVRSLFNDEDRALAQQLLSGQQSQIQRRDEAAETAAVARDQKTVADVAARRRAVD